jgi:ribosome-associated toxin RatA of RatAB toxin-antitoxin module
MAMTKFTKTIQVNSEKVKVWDILSNLGDVYKFNPNVSSSHYSTEKKEGIGAARVCELIPSGKILETVVYWEDGKGFSLDIEPIEKAPPIKDFKGHFQIESLGANHTEVSATMDYKMKFGPLGYLMDLMMVKSKMEDNIDKLLNGLKAFAEQPENS